MSSINDNLANYKEKKSNTTFAVLISCCLFLFIICTCLMSALVLIGKHLIHTNHSDNNKLIPSVHNNKSFTNMEFLRLPNYVIPVQYDITLKPNLKFGQFGGSIKIAINITQATKTILLNCKDLTIINITLQLKTDFKLFKIDNITTNNNKEILLISLNRTIGPNLYLLLINYNGSLQKRNGFYKSAYYYDKEGETVNKRYIATSKFEPTYARQAYPCFDEPNLKATFKVHILKPKLPNYIALSNYPQYAEEEQEDGIMVHFNETVPMSTYLSCFIVSDFVFSETFFTNAQSGEKIPFRVYASPGQLNKTQYAGRIGSKVIKFYIEYFGISYPLPKLDLVAIPDFVSGAMEHWGLVTFRETALLYSNETHSSNNKQRVATVVAHELAHSWFGNLVTMDWWNNLWLNEGFASYIEYKGVDHCEPTWNMMDQFLIDDLHSVLSLDATEASHPIIQTVKTPDQITEVFDTISYNKGASVLRMLENVVGEENFKKGVTNYLNKFKYKNAVTQDLWNEIQLVIGNLINITEFMNTFTTQMGYPILNLTITSDKYLFKQNRFLKNPNYKTTNYKWTVPLSYITDKGKSDIIWFDSSTDELIIEKPENVKFIKFNPGQYGYYRINYPENEWRNFFELVQNLSIADRAHLLEESFSIAEAGQLNYTIPLDLCKYLINEHDYVPWVVASTKLTKIQKILLNSEYEGKFKQFIIGLLKAAYWNLTWNEDSNDGHLKRLTRIKILKLACAMSYEDALKTANAKFNEWINGNTNLSQDLRVVIYKYGMVNSNEEIWQKLFKKFVNETDANEKNKLMCGLTAIKNQRLLIKLIELAKDDTFVRSQDYFTLLQYIAENPIGTSIVWDYVRENWLYLVQRFTLNDRYLGKLIPSITNHFTTNTKLEEKYPNAGAGASARLQTIDTVKSNIKWLASYKETVENWIRTQEI